MSEKAPSSRLNDFDKNAEAAKVAEYESALYGEAGSTDFSDEARNRVEEAHAYELHMQKLMEENGTGELSAQDEAYQRRTSFLNKLDTMQDENGIYDEAAINAEKAAEEAAIIESKIGGDAKLRRMNMIADEIAGLRGDLSDENRSRVADLEDKLNDLLVAYEASEGFDAEVADYLINKTAESSDVSASQEQAREDENHQESDAEAAPAEASQHEEEGSSNETAHEDIETIRAMHAIASLIESLQRDADDANRRMLEGLRAVLAARLAEYEQSEDYDEDVAEMIRDTAHSSDDAEARERLDADPDAAERVDLNDDEAESDEEREARERLDADPDAASGVNTDDLDDPVPPRGDPRAEVNTETESDEEREAREHLDADPDAAERVDLNDDTEGEQTEERRGWFRRQRDRLSAYYTRPVDENDPDSGREVHKRRVVVTALGAVAAIGVGLLVWKYTGSVDAMPGSDGGAGGAGSGELPDSGSTIDSSDAGSVPELPSTPDVIPDTTPDVTPEVLSGADQIDAGEGFIQTFTEMGITDPEVQQSILGNTDAMNQLVEMGVAYEAPELGGYGLYLNNGILPEAAQDIIRAASNR